MIKYKDYYVVFEEIPDEVTLAINISNCQNRCIGCHSPELRENLGEELTEEKIDEIIDKCFGITCFCFMGEGKDYEKLVSLSQYIKNKYDIKTAVYSGRDVVEETYYKNFDYVKIGRYDAKFGPLNSETTNQKLYLMENGIKTDITYKFWKRM